MFLNKNLKKKIILELKKFPKKKKRSSIISILSIIQNKYNYISNNFQKKVSNYLNIPVIEIKEILTFYKMFNLNPINKNKIVICNSLSCYLSGSLNIFNYFKKKIKILKKYKKKFFSLNKGECMGSCDKAPIIFINNKYILKKVSKRKIDLLINKFYYELFT